MRSVLRSVSLGTNTFSILNIRFENGIKLQLFSQILRAHYGFLGSKHLLKQHRRR